MKEHIIILIAAVSICLTGLSQATWQPVTSPVNENLVSVCFVDMQHGWILSDQGTLISTADGGLSWQTLSLGPGTYTSVFFADQDHGFITGYQDSSFIMLTTDGGSAWQLSDHQKADRLNDVFFYDADHGWVVGIKDNKNYNLYTEDGGESWVPQMTIFVLEAELYSVSFRDGQIGNTCGAGGAFFTTNSAGTTGWAMDISIPALGVDLYSVYNWGMMTGCAVGESGTALYTTNRWSSYIETSTNSDQILYGVSGDPATSWLWAVGENGTIIFTSNYLFGWASQVSGTTEDLMDVAMIDQSNGWAVGDNGTILHYASNTGIGDPANPNTAFDINFYPNPTNGSVTGHWSLVTGQSVRILIYDVYGREIATILDRHMQAGEHTIQYDLSGLPDGIYLVRLQVGSETVTEKILHD